ncbi:hypothetical protein VP01_569g5 [Puccinia sorghi]|uniref:Uncharacterized protein n=1 Tax=Puccinia sorghi TaxID=27349 RepID=A0A0L6UJF4_9BASI|nr:hypothetical protein VP01_569g5 [Puccinia sorghi]
MSTSDFFNEGGSAVVSEPEPAQEVHFSQFVLQFQTLHNSELQYQLRNDLVQHLWMLKGSPS